jgi:chromosomal replication initiation ATPase DnaA
MQVEQQVLIEDEQPVIDIVTSAVEETYQVSMDEVRGMKRSPLHNKARMACVFFLNAFSRLSVKQIGEVVGRDHTTVLYVFKKAQQQFLAKDPQFVTLHEIISERIESLKNA